MTSSLFHTYIPLSNWLLGFDRYRFTYSKAAIPRARFPGVFYVIDPLQDEHRQLVLAKTHSLIERLGIDHDRMVCLEVMLPVGENGAQPNVFTGTGIGWRWPSDELPLHRVGFVDDQGHVNWTHHEEITAQSYLLKNTLLQDWADCEARTFSVLPVAQACNASCAFCFSKASMSDAIVPQKVDLHSVKQWANLARQRGATRSVITGGGEPTVIPFEAMRDLIATLHESLDRVLIITNGYRIQQWAEKEGEAQAVAKLQQWKQAGLERIALSRHGFDLVSDAAIMGLAVNTPYVASLIQQAGLATRYIGVMQQGGIDSPEALQTYLERSAQDGVPQVCLKELYVSSLSENPWGSSKENLYCQDNQVPLSMAVETLEQLGFVKVAQLPWGSPVYQGMISGVMLEVAAYTEPSVGWERSQGIVRSWNWMSNGECLASLEDPKSRLTHPDLIHHTVKRKTIPLTVEIG